MSEQYKPLSRKQRAAKLTNDLGTLLGKPFYLEAWSPGDGWTRYRIAEKSPDYDTTGGIQGYYSPSVPLSEFETMIEFALKVAYDARSSSL
jgi:hypothetical protein